MTDPRVRPGTRSEIGAINWGIARISGRVTGTTPPNLFLTLGRHRKLFRGWLRFAGRLMPGGTLPRKETELVILRVAHLRSSTYEFEHHVRVGRKVGLRDDIFGAVTRPLSEGTWTDRQRVILSAVDRLVSEHDLDDETWADLRSHLDDRGCIELVMLVGHYEMLATLLATLRVPQDAPR
jgi:alkylhydroperoxidase family enzyme